MLLSTQQSVFLTDQGVIVAIRRLKSSGDRHRSHHLGWGWEDKSWLNTVNVYWCTLGFEKWCLWILRTVDLDFCVRDTFPSGGAVACCGDPDQALPPSLPPVVETRIKHWPPPPHTHTSVVENPHAFFSVFWTTAILKELIFHKTVFHVYVCRPIFILYLCRD